MNYWNEVALLVELSLAIGGVGLLLQQIAARAAAEALVRIPVRTDDR